jgi:hypothetical protein
MKKSTLSIFVLLFLSLCSIPSFGQEETSFGAFIASPVGKFKSTDLDGGGFAKQGWGIVLDSKNNIKGLPEGLTAYFHGTFQFNEMDTETLAKEFTAGLGNRTEISDSKYSPILTTIGPAYEFSLSEKIKFGVNGTAGIIFNNTKAFTIKVYDSNNTLIVNELVNFDNKVAFAYSFGAELKFVLVPDLIGFSLYSDYTSANQSTDITSQNIQENDSFQKLQYFNLGGKLVFKKK